MKYSVRDLSLLIEREKVFVLGLSNAVGRRITSQAAEVLQTVFQRVSKWYCKFVSDPVNLVVNLKRQPRIWKKKNYYLTEHLHKQRRFHCHLSCKQILYSVQRKHRSDLFKSSAA